MPQPANVSSLSSFPQSPSPLFQPLNPRLGQKFQSIKCHDRNHQQQAVSKKDKGSRVTPHRAHRVAWKPHVPQHFTPQMAKGVALFLNGLPCSWSCSIAFPYFLTSCVNKLNHFEINTLHWHWQHYAWHAKCCWN